MTFEKFKYPLLIREKHLDTFGHVNNAAYLDILEEARWEFINARGFGLADIAKTGLGPTILEINMKFLKELRLRQNVEIESETLSYDRKVGELRQTIFDENNQICFEAKMKIGLFDLKIRKLAAPTPEWLYAIGS